LAEKIIFEQKNIFWPKKSFLSKKIFFGRKNHFLGNLESTEIFMRIFIYKVTPIFRRYIIPFWVRLISVQAFLALQFFFALNKVKIVKKGRNLLKFFNKNF